MALYRKRYTDADPADLCITQDKKSGAEKLFDERRNRKKLQQIENDRCVKQAEKQAEKQIKSRAQNTLEKEKQESDQDAESVTVIRDVIEEVFS